MLTSLSLNTLGMFVFGLWLMVEIRHYKCLQLKMLPFFIWKKNPLCIWFLSEIFFEFSVTPGHTLHWVQVMHLDAEKEMMSQCVALLGKFIAVREPNIRYLGLVSYLFVTRVNSSKFCFLSLGCFAYGLSNPPIFLHLSHSNSTIRSRTIYNC